MLSASCLLLGLMKRRFGGVSVSTSWVVLVTVMLCLMMGEGMTRSTVHAPRSRLHKLDCKVSRQKILNASDEGMVLVIGGK